MTNSVLKRLAMGLTAFACFTMFASEARAQLPIPSLSAMGGVTSFDLSGTGSTAIGALRLSVPLAFLIAEGSLAAMAPKEQDGRRTYIIPEAQLQYQLFPLVIKPYIGAGAGWIKAVSGVEPHRSDVTYSASVGVRTSTPLGLRGEIRVRGVGSGFAGSATEFLVGIGF